jgi:hypothetical protein
MALSDLLWACPTCGEPGGIASDGACRCGVTFRRRRGSTIQATMPDGRVVDRAPAAWVDRLPDPDTLLEQGAGEGIPLRRAAITARESTGSTPLRSGNRYLNQVEVYGPERTGDLELHPDRLVYRTEDRNDREWPLQQLTAVQTSSRTLQLRVRGQPLVSIRFHDDSLFLWETLLHAALRSFYRRTGRGEIAEFQPRIVTRP